MSNEEYNGKVELKMKYPIKDTKVYKNIMQEFSDLRESVYSLQLDIAGISLVTNEDTPLIVKAFTKVYKDIDILKEKFIKECPQFIESKHEVKTFGMKE